MRRQRKDEETYLECAHSDVVTDGQLTAVCLERGAVHPGETQRELWQGNVVVDKHGAVVSQQLHLRLSSVVSVISVVVSVSVGVVVSVTVDIIVIIIFIINITAAILSIIKMITILM